MQREAQLYATAVNPIEIDARINALVAQRNNAQNEAAVLIGKLALAETKIVELRETLAKQTGKTVAALTEKTNGAAAEQAPPTSAH